MQTIDVEAPTHADYWHALCALMQQQIDSEVAAERADRAVVRTGNAANGAAAKPALAAVETIVAEALQGTQEELNELEEMVAQELAAPDCADPEFWTAVRPRYISYHVAGFTVRPHGRCIARCRTGV